MSKRYMDFVPLKNVDKKTAVVSGVPRRTNVTGAAKRPSSMTTSTVKPRVLMPESTATPRTRMVRRDVSRKIVSRKAVGHSGVVEQQRVVTMSQTRTMQGNMGGFAIRDDAKLGEVEDLNPKFVKTDVPKRPLGDGSARKTAIQQTAKDEAKEVKSKRLIGRFRGKTVKAETKGNAKAVSKKEKNATAGSTFVAPKPAFINQDKVVKRPLSKNVYQKNIVATSESGNKAPVAIIAKPEKESKIGLVVAIILTIILGAVAGTIAFLLLPK